MARATERGLDAVTVSPWLVRTAGRLAAGSSLVVNALIDAPAGLSLASTKAEAASEALEQGATEIEVALNGARLLSGDEAGVHDELVGVVDLAHSALARAAVAIPPSLVEPAVWRACVLIEQSGADRVVVGSVESAPDGVLDLVRLVRRAVGPRVTVKALAAFAAESELAAAAQAGAEHAGASFIAEFLDARSPVAVVAGG
jgi:deoxyribose-phosphate aldolase